MSDVCCGLWSVVCDLIDSDDGSVIENNPFYTKYMVIILLKVLEKLLNLIQENKI